MQSIYQLSISQIIAVILPFPGSALPPLNGLIMPSIGEPLAFPQVISLSFSRIRLAPNSASSLSRSGLIFRCCQFLLLHIQSLRVPGFVGLKYYR